MPSPNNQLAAATRPSTWARAAAPAVAALLVLGLSGCGAAADDTRVCDEVRRVLTDVSKTGLDQISDPAAVQRTYRDGAATIRQEAQGAGGDVKAAADDVAGELEQLGDGLGALAGSPSAIPQLPDLDGLTTAGRHLQQACT